jgi:photosystem II stability/assembly factor-like uncharacterized protein
MRLRVLTATLLPGLLAVAPAPYLAAQPRPTATPSLVAGIADAELLADLRFRSIGPAVMSGRISDIAVPPPDRAGGRAGRVIYVTSAGGGAWKTTNGGKTWSSITDALPVGSMGAIAVAPSDPRVVYLGTGESNNLRSSSWGNGVYRSTDGGATWTHVGLERSQHIARIIVDPRDPDVAYVAAMGPLWGPGGERGLFRTDDGGRTWTLLQSFNATTGVTDVAFDPSDPDVLYSVSYERERRPWSFVAGGPNSGLWKSTDAGTTWTALTNGVPDGDKGRMGVTVCASRTRTVYATVHHASESGVYASDDGGASWERRSNVMSIPWFFGQIRCDPSDPARVYFLGVQLQVSDDGGRTWRTIAQRTHADHHAMWIDPADPNHLMIGNDGGFFISHDRGETWDFALNLPVSTFYTVAVDQREPFYWIYGGTQDNGTWAGPVATRNRSGIMNTDWVRIGGGDGFYAAIDPTDPYTAYAESQNGALTRVDVLLDERKSIRPTAAPGQTLRWNWSSPLLISPHDHRTLYFGANYLFKSTDRGDTWTALGGDLTRQLDRDTLPIMGLRGAGGLGRHDGTAAFGNLSTLDVSALRPGLIYVGTDDGLIQVSEDDGASWRRSDRFPGVPELTYVSRVIASRHRESRAYATFDGHRNNDFRPYVHRSDDYGRSWTPIASNLPDWGSVQVIREHHRNADLLFVGTEFGVFLSVDGGRAWTRMPGIPATAVHDMVIHERENDLVVATHGRGIFVLDDIGPLERLAEAARARVAHVFPPRPATIFNPATGPSLGFGDRQYNAPNPPAGAVIDYLVAAGAPPDARFSLAIVDARGETVRTLPANGAPGIRRATWDLRYEGVTLGPPPAARPATEEEDPGPPAPAGPAGPYAAPGTYRIELRMARGAGADTVVGETRLEVRRDPLVRLTDAEYRDLHETRMRALALQRAVRDVFVELDAGRARVAAAVARADTTAVAGRAALELQRELDAALEAVRGPQRAAGPGGGGGLGFGAQAGGGLFGRVTGVANGIGTLHFVPTPEHRATLDAVAHELETARLSAAGLLGRVDGVVRGVGGE